MTRLERGSFAFPCSKSATRNPRSQRQDAPPPSGKIGHNIFACVAPGARAFAPTAWGQRGRGLGITGAARFVPCQRSLPGPVLSPFASARNYAPAACISPTATVLIGDDSVAGPACTRPRGSLSSWRRVHPLPCTWPPRHCPCGRGAGPHGRRLLHAGGSPCRLRRLRRAGRQRCGARHAAGSA
jgi:hypothetical protein